MGVSGAPRPGGPRHFRCVRKALPENTKSMKEKRNDKLGMVLAITRGSLSILTRNGGINYLRKSLLKRDFTPVHISMIQARSSSTRLSNLSLSHRVAELEPSSAIMYLRTSFTVTSPTSEPRSSTRMTLGLQTKY